MGADSSDIYRSLEQRIDNVVILGGVLKTEPKSKQKTGTGNRGLGGTACVGHAPLQPYLFILVVSGSDFLPQVP